MLVTYKNRKVEIDQIEGTPDEPQVINAYYLDGDEELLTSEEMDELVEIHAEKISEYIYDKALSKAEDLYDFYNDR